MKIFVALLTILVALILVVPAFAGQQPYKAAVCEDQTASLAWHLGPKVYQFTHADTCYYDTPYQFLVCDPNKVSFPECRPYGTCYLCTSLCKEYFDSKTGATEPELCCVKNNFDETGSTETNGLVCPDIDPANKTALTTKGNSGWYEWVIALPKKPEGEINLEIQCAVLKPNETDILNCAAETGELVDTSCTRLPGTYLKQAALPTITASAYPGGQNNFTPFHLTAYKNPSDYKISRQGPGGQFPGALSNSASLQILCGGTRIALKACLEKTILIKWPKEGEINSLGEVEANLEAGDIIKVKMFIPIFNTVDIYCGMYSVTIGGIGEPLTFTPDSQMPQKYDCGF
jgi:hypothetical protein